MVLLVNPVVERELCRLRFAVQISQQYSLLHILFPSSLIKLCHMATTQTDKLRAMGNDPGSRTSDVPLLGEGFSENAPSTVPSAIGDNGQEANSSEQEPKTGIRRFWNLGKKKEEIKPKKPETTKAAPEAVKPITPSHATAFASTTSSPQYPPQHYALPSSPGRNIRSSSPRMPSPASSQIFERNVQEEGISATSPAIPAHITTENHIPPVLDASSMAITDDHLSPDAVEIVMHSAHLPAAVTVTGTHTSTSEAAGAPWADDLVAHPDSEDAASNYGALDSADVRRLSFISFADVVHAEQADHSSLRDSVLLSNVPSLGSPAGARSPSPMRSPVSPPMSASPSFSPNFRNVETSPHRGLPGSPRMGFGNSPPVAGELTIETLTQSIRKSGSRDLTGVRSAPMSAGEGEEHPFR